MIAWSIAVAHESGMFERVIVSTDDEEIAAVASMEGADVPFIRPAELSDDYSSTTRVIAHAAHWLLDRAETHSALCCLYATAPLVRSEDIVSSHARLLAGKWDYVFPVARFNESPYRAFARGSDGRVAMLFPKYELTRTQDLPPVYHDVGQFYWGRFDAWLDCLPIYSSRSSTIEIPVDRVVDIDTPADWARAEQTMATMQKDCSPDELRKLQR